MLLSRVFLQVSGSHSLGQRFEPCGGRLGERTTRAGGGEKFIAHNWMECAGKTLDGLSGSRDKSAAWRAGAGIERLSKIDGVEKEGVKNKKPHRNAVCNSSSELVRNRWNPIGRFRLPVKACRPRAKSGFLDLYFLRFEDFVSIHEHGRVNLFAFPKIIARYYQALICVSR